ncbi:hypothetical protein A8B98_03995 [Hymenobacter sp. UV11]|nr:hypothetical protein A8B98_03995 [Hymenobacter sp. UV11]
MGFLAAIGYGFANGTADSFTVIFLLLLASISIWLGWRTVTDTKPSLQFGRNGIWTRKLGDVKWQDVLLEFSRVSTGKAGSFETLKILDRQTVRQLDSVIISTFSESVETLKTSLQNCKKAKFK